MIPYNSRRGALAALSVWFLLSCGLAWGLMPVLGWAAGGTAVDATELLGRIENGEWAGLPDGLRLPPSLLYVLTRFQDFAFTISALVTAAIFYGKSGVGIVMSGLAPARASAKWIGAALLLPVLAYALAIIVAALGEPNVLGTVDLSLGTVSTVLIGPAGGLLTFLILRAGLGEEPGLRGFALPLMLSLASPLRAGLVLGGLWALWHAPVLLGRDIVEVMFFVVLNLALSLLFTWFFLKARGSIWPVALLHAAINAGDRMAETILPGLAAMDWQIPAYLVLILMGVAAGFALARPAMKEAVAELSQPS